MKKIIYIFIIFIKNFIKNKNYNFFLYHDEISKISIDFWTGEACYVRGAKIGCFGRVTSETSLNVSRFGTHRSNEWEGRCGVLVHIHAARDGNKQCIKFVKLYINEYPQASGLSDSSECL
jgi:hypothetical protein